MDANVISEKLATCVNLIMNPQADHMQRQEAYKVCEEFKENSPLCTQCGLLLSEIGRPPIIRHFGLQLIEHCIKFRWNDLHLEEKLFIKENALRLLSSGTHPVMVEETYIKDALSRIIVEMIKREWPQQWPTLLQELHEVCSCGETQIELVLLIFLRLAEDIAIFQNVHQNQRRKEIYQTMTTSLSEIFPFFLRTLNDQYIKYNQQKAETADINKQQMQVHARVAEVCLKTLAGFVEWVPLIHVTADDNLLLRVLCALLRDSLLQMAAVECLLLLVGRKGNLEERKALLYLFGPETMSVIFEAASSANNLHLEEQHFLFLKKLCQVLTNLGLQLTSLWGTLDGVAEPPTFSRYVDSMLSFTKHPSHVLNCYTLCLWSSFCQNVHTSASETLKAVLLEVVKAFTGKLLRVGFPSKNDSPSCDYSRMDFDSDEEFIRFHNKFRVEVTDVLRQITLLQPDVCIPVGEQWLQTLFLETEKSCQSMQLSNISSLQQQWNGLEQFFDGIHNIFTSEKGKPYVAVGLRLLETLLSVETQDAVILSSLLSCISSFFSILALDGKLLPKVLDKVFSVVLFTAGETKACRSKGVRNVRRHACSFLIRICKQYASLILPAFGHIYKHIKSICGNAEQLSHMENSALHEALILISNQLCDYEKQRNFLGEIIAPVSQVWLSEEIKMAFSSSEAFITFIGLDRDPVSLDGEDVCATNRSLVMYCVQMIMSFIKRTAWPAVVEAAAKGGFLCSQEVNASGQLFRNPVAPHIIPLLNGLFSLVRVLNSLFGHEAALRINPVYATVLDMHENEKARLLGMNNSKHPEDTYGDALYSKSAVERMKNFLTTLHENCFHAIGSAAQNLGMEFYAVPELPSFLASDAFACLDCLPDYRLRFFNRCFMKSFLQSCQPSHYNLAIAVLELFCPFMYQKLSTKWEKFRQVYGTSVGYEDEMTEAQEVVDDQLNRWLTREYIEILGVVLAPKRADQSNSDNQEITDLGKLILRKDSLRPVIVMTLFSCIQWLDANASLRILYLCPFIIKQLIADSLISQEAEVTYLLNSILLGLQSHGEHESNQALLLSTGVLVYESLKPLFPGIGEKLAEATGCKMQSVQKFDEMLVSHSARKHQTSEKKKKEMFRNLVSEIIGKSVGQHYKREIKIRNLPPMFLPPRPKTRSLDEAENKDMGLCSLFSNSSTDCASRTISAVSNI